MPTNKQIILKKRPQGMPQESDFALRKVETPELQDGQVLVRTGFISVDPYMRGRISGIKTYIDPIPVDGVVEGGSAGVVEASKHPGFREGDTVHGMWGWQTYGVVPGETLQRADVSLAPLSTFLGVLGMPGLTAYFGMLDVGQPKAGDTVFISGAAGAVGSIAGQIAKLQGCHVAGSAGAPEKTAYLLGECKFDAAFNYKDYAPATYGEALKGACPNGIDVYFDNVGGPLTDAVILQFNEHARMAICGQIDQYNEVNIPQGPRLLFQFIIKRARAEGFLIFDFAQRFEEGQRQLARWLTDGSITHRETITDGIENTPKAFIGLFTGTNIGKQLVRVRESD